MTLNLIWIKTDGESSFLMTPIISPTSTLKQVTALAPVINAVSLRLNSEFLAILSDGKLMIRITSVYVASSLGSTQLLLSLLCLMSVRAVLSAWFTATEISTPVCSLFRRFRDGMMTSSRLPTAYPPPLFKKRIKHPEYSACIGQSSTFSSFAKHW